MVKGIVQNLNYRADEGINVSALATFIEDALMQKQRNGQKQKKSFSPSTIGYGHGNCPRYWYMAFNGADFQETSTPQGIANMENGSFTHDRLQALLESTGIVKTLEQEITLATPPIRGFIDAIIEWQGDTVVVEIKSAKQEVFQIRKTSMRPPLNHMLQILLYMYVTDNRYGVFIYENKNTQELLLIPVAMNDRRKKVLQEVLDWMERVHKNWQDDKLPVRPYTKSSRVCKNCPLYKQCWAGPQGDINIEEMPVSKLQ